MSLSNFNLRSLFDAIAWTPMTELEFSVYPTLIKMFYANMEIGTGRKVIHSYVKGRKIKVTKERINEIIGITNEGVNAYKFGSWPKMEGFDKLLATRRLLGYDVANAIKLNCNQSPVRIRLLHAIIFKAFNVTLDDETNVERLTNYNTINRATVGRLGYKLDQNGT
ncbi:hypothetical protein PanWU01x14_100550 [Parasponia andersonii]|uniref:Uncharacterized protein n=1 Tax=Parasponia andersonii TaxID=3476 RepID=A0A2P5D3L1_PARAD|nr:hypothetical protein PanWU01x14_100550 [Parasponia andersonii]